MEQPVVPINAAVEVEEENDAMQQSISENDNGEGPSDGPNDEHNEEMDPVDEGGG